MNRFGGKASSVGDVHGRRVPWVSGWWAAVLVAAALFTGLVVAQDAYLAYVATSWVVAGILALSLDLVWGRGGILSLGHTALYGLGGYAAGVAAINGVDVVGNTLLLVLPVGALVGAAAAAALGWLMVYARMGPLQQTILTYTFTVMLWTTTVSFSGTFGDAVVGGQNGLSAVPGLILGFGPDATEVGSRVLFVVSVLIGLGALALARVLVTSSFGTVTDAIRLDEGKAELLGFDTRAEQWRLLVISGALAGLAGGMFTLWANFINPSTFSVQDALLVPISVLVGGIGTLIGGFVGAVTIGGLTYWLGGGAGGGQTTIWLGLALILLVRFNRSGVLGLAQALVRRARHRPGAASAATRQVAVDHSQLTRISGGNARPPGELATSDAAVTFGGVRPVAGVSLRFVAGRITCLIGPNGAGKSSYLKLCTGAYTPSAGSVSLSGVDVTRMPPHRRVALGLGIKNQKAQVFGALDVRTNLWVAAYGRCRDGARARDLAEEMLHLLGLADRASTPAGDLPHGDQQWVDIGMLLCQQPTVMLLDEPAAGMAPGEREQLAALLRSLARHVAIVVVEHDMAFVRSLDPAVVVLHQGEVFAEGEIAELQRNSDVLDIYLGRRRRHVLD